MQSDGLKRVIPDKYESNSRALHGSFRRHAVSGARPALRLMREGLARTVLETRRRGRGPMLVFLPAGPPKEAALLRIYNMASALRCHGWRTAVVPWKLSLAARRRYLAAAAPDVLVMQGVRHPLNRPRLYPDAPIVFDVDDADFHIAQFADPMREAMHGVAGVIAGSRYVADWCCENGAPWAEVVWTGTPISTGPRPKQSLRRPIIAWAQTRPQNYRREAAFVARVMAEVAAARPGVVLRLYDRRPGDDPTFADRFRAPGLHIEWREVCRYDDYLKSFDDVSIGLAPLCPETPFSRGKSFGKVLAYLDREVVVVGSDAGEHGAFFDSGIGVIGNDEDNWVAEILCLVDSAARREQLVEAASERFKARLSVEAAAKGLAATLARTSVSGGGIEPWGADLVTAR